MAKDFVGWLNISIKRKEHSNSINDRATFLHYEKGYILNVLSKKKTIFFVLDEINFVKKGLHSIFLFMSNPCIFFCFVKCSRSPV